MLNEMLSGAFGGNAIFDDVFPLGDGISNKSYHFSCGGDRYVARVTENPAPQMDKLHYERMMYEELKRKGATFADEVVFFDADAGIKVTKYICGARYPDTEDASDIARCVKLLRLVHESGVEVGAGFDLMECFLGEEELVARTADPEEHMKGYEGLRSVCVGIYEASEDIFKRKFNHIDPIRFNFLFTSLGDRLIDFEYSRMASPMIDLAAFAVYHKLSVPMIDAMLAQYLGRNPSRYERVSLFKYLPLEGIFSALWYLARLDRSGRMRDSMNGCYACAGAYADEAARMRNVYKR